MKERNLKEERAERLALIDTVNRCGEKYRLRAGHTVPFGYYLMFAENEEFSEQMIHLPTGNSNRLKDLLAALHRHFDEVSTDEDAIFIYKVLTKDKKNRSLIRAIGESVKRREALYSLYIDLLSCPDVTVSSVPDGWVSEDENGNVTKFKGFR